MTWLNPDRAQLLALADADDAAHGQCSASAGSGLASTVSIAPQPSGDGVRSLVASRSKRLQHSNNEQRKRYLRVHTLLNRT